MIRAGWIPAAISALAGAVLLLGAPAGANDMPTRLRDLVDGFRTEYGFPGATVGIALPGGEVVTVATGLADVEAETPMTPDSRMLAASIGKSFVAATVLALEAEGLLTRSEFVSDHLGTRDWFARLPNHSTMTIGDLLRHGAGLQDHVHTEAFAEEMAARMARGADALSPVEAIAFVLDADPLFPAGSGWAYSDTGYLLLGLVIEQVTGGSYYEAVAERFLGPLGLDATAPSDWRDLAALAVGYTTPDNPFGIPTRTMDTAGRLVWDPAMEWTGGGLVSTSHDLALWGHVLFGGGAMPVPYLDRLLDGIAIAPDAPGILYGAGVTIYADTPRGPVYGHGGWIPGYVSSLRHYPDHGVTVAFQINTDVGIVNDSTDLVPALEAALADLAIGSGNETERP